MYITDVFNFFSGIISAERRAQSAERRAQSAEPNSFLSFSFLSRRNENTFLRFFTSQNKTNVVFCEPRGFDVEFVAFRLCERSEAVQETYLRYVLSNCLNQMSVVVNSRGAVLRPAKILHGGVGGYLYEKSLRIVFRLFCPN